MAFNILERSQISQQRQGKVSFINGSTTPSDVEISAISLPSTGFSTILPPP
jgi:hypothetical protein